MLREKELTGHYFTYCQWCKNDGKCVLRHHEFLGLPAGEGTDRTSYSSHEDLSWGFSAFQKGVRRGRCVGRILASGSVYLPLVCECGTAINSLTFATVFNTGLCGKFEPNEKGKERMQIAKEIARRRHLALAKVDPEWLPDPDPNYWAEMEY